MAVSTFTGSQIDYYNRKFNALLIPNLQQKGSVFRNLVDLDPAAGDKTYFTKIDVQPTFLRSNRYANLQYGPDMFERRFFSPQIAYGAKLIDDMDLARFVETPQNAYLDAITYAINRFVDNTIITAMAGPANIETNGTGSTVNFDTTNQQVAVNNNQYTSLSGNTFLHEGKITMAKRILEGNFVDTSIEQVICVAPSKQLAALRSRVYNNQSIAYQSGVDMNEPGLDRGLTLEGVKFYKSELLGLDGSNNQYAYMFVPSAMKLGIWRDLRTDIRQNPTIEGLPWQIYADIQLGAVRMFEQKVVRIVCDPT